MEVFLKDLKYSLRAFLQRPAFAIAALATLTLAISANTAMFSVVNAVLLKPIPAPEPDRVVIFMSTNREGSSSDASEIKFNIWREQTNIFEDVSGYYTLGSLSLTGVDQPQRVDAMFVTADYFHLFGLTMVQGRSFTAQEERPNGSNVVVLGNAFWKRAFGGDPRIIGKVISLSGASYEVIGILGGGIHPESGDTPDIWMPFPIDPNSSYQPHYFQVMGRLRPGATLASANAHLQLATQKFRRKFPNALSTSRGDVFSVAPLQDVLVRDVRSSLLILAGAVTLVLLIACTNIAGLLLVRAVGRRREFAVRIATGASRGRIIRQLLTESVLLSAVGAIFGLLLGAVSIHALLALNPAQIPRIGVHGSKVTVDCRVLAFTALIALIAALVFGLIPAFQASSRDLNTELKGGGGRTGAAIRETTVRSLLVISEMSLALLLLISAALLIRTLVALRSVNPGFDPRNVVTSRTMLEPRSAKRSSVDQIVQDAFRRLNALPGVESAAYTKLLPLGGGFNSLPIIVVGRPLNGPSHGSSRWMVVSSRYLDVLKIRLIRGRSLTDSDRLGAPGVAIINQTMARQFWHNSASGGDALGARIFIGKGLGPNFEEPARQIVGIVSDVHENALGLNPQAAVFVPGAQISDARMVNREVSWVIRTRAQSRGLYSAILRELRQATGEPVPPLRSMDEVVARSIAREKFNMLLMSIFAGSALLLAAFGVYGLMAYSVQQRTREMGIRMALGAKSNDVRNMVVFQGMRLTFLGAGIGMAAALGVTRFLAGFLFHVTALDPVVFILVPILLSGVAFAAVWAPACGASRVDPMNALRHE